MARSAREQPGHALPLEIVALPSLQLRFPVAGPKNNPCHDRGELSHLQHVTTAAP